MNSPLFKLSSSEWLQSALNAAFVAIVMALGSVVVAGFSVWDANWISIGKTLVDAGFIAFVTNISGHLLTTQEGNFMGIIKVKKS